jgi:hypothetical protein
MVILVTEPPMNESLWGTFTKVEAIGIITNVLFFMLLFKNYINIAHLVKAWLGGSF